MLDFSDQDPERAPSEQGCAQGAAQNPQLAPLPETRMLFKSHLLPMFTLTCDQDLEDAFVGIKQLILLNIEEMAFVDIIYWHKLFFAKMEVIIGQARPWMGLHLSGQIQLNLWTGELVN